MPIDRFEQTEFKDKLQKMLEDCYKKAALEFFNKFLEITGLKIGDVVDCYFAYNDGDKEKKHAAGIHKGVLKESEQKGFLYVESVEDFTICTKNYNPETKLDEYIFEVKKAISNLQDMRYPEKVKKGIK